ncbi:MAG: thioredoxin family protein [Rhodospirillales bacterium]|nr:thioredoxin family protein [Rhodospirillales bacterium]
MAAVETPVCDFGWKAKDFDLEGIDGKRYRLADVRGPKGTLVAFICNHCPYVRAIATRLAEDAKALQAAGIGVVGIMPNDTTISPGDSFDKMKDFARQHGFTFPYVIDRTQDVARTYGARCTPDFFGFNAALELQYRGRFDASGREPAPKGMRAELLEAMTAVAATGKGPKAQTPSVGCSVKWRN